MRLTRISQICMGLGCQSGGSTGQTTERINQVHTDENCDQNKGKNRSRRRYTRRSLCLDNDVTRPEVADHCISLGLEDFFLLAYQNKVQDFRPLTCRGQPVTSDLRFCLERFVSHMRPSKTDGSRNAFIQLELLEILKSQQYAQDDFWGQT
ncbi:hypothetical protein RRG08_020122 [Elysia crispata]|uniref:Uncharacterized protein n=1 Tax=Elysia crispata TaxID=231223 RepID=A0AAE1DTL6_9GAST|nr:hypothetical protein RRG08_020122 [Elysia crispata]